MAHVRVPRGTAHTLEEGTGNRMRQFPPLIDSRVVRPSQTALVLGLVTEMQLLRLKTLARWYARGLPADATWEDLLQEALTRILMGKRQVPEGVTIVAFVAGIMRSLRSERWERLERVLARERRRSDSRTSVAQPRTELIDSTPGPERVLMAQEQLAAIRDLFAEDRVALTILDALAQGLTAEEIRAANGMSETDYASARKRMRRVLLREGLTCTPR